MEIATSQKEIINPLGDFGCCYADSTGLVLHCAWLKKIWMFLLLLIQNCAIWLMAENRFVLSFTYTKLILFLLPCNLFVCGSFELYPNGKFTKKKLRDVRILQVFTWAPFRLWWLMSLPTYKNIDIRYINKMFFLLCQAISYN